MALFNVNFFSKYLVCNTEVSIIMPNFPFGNKTLTPEEFYSTGKKYKMLLLLHGMWEDHTSWIRYSNIETYATENDLVVVMPQGVNGNWINWNNFGYNPGFKLFDYLYKELLPMVRGWLPVSDKKEDTFVAGHSMGGCGAMRLALQHPELFAACATMSSNERSYPTFYEKNLAKGNKTVTNWIDNAGGIEKFLETPENVRGYIEKLKAEGRLGEIPPVYIATGGDDDEAHLKQFNNWVEYCREMGLDITVNIEEGYGHDGWYFDKELKNVLRFFGFEIKDL